jgi:hypothetical protein
MHISPTRAVILIAIVGLMVPIPQDFVGEWTVRVSDYDNRPISGARVSLSWKNYTFNVLGEQQDLYTNAEGKVTFGVQRKYGPLLYWAAKATANLVGFGMHAGFGTMARVWVSEIATLDPERKERLRGQNVTDALTSTCGSKCSAERLDSHLQIPIP